MIFSAKITAENNEVLDVLLDSEGLEELLRQLGYIEQGRTDHVHLMSEDWGGDVLSSSSLHHGRFLNHIKITLVDGRSEIAAA